MVTAGARSGARSRPCPTLPIWTFGVLVLAGERVCRAVDDGVQIVAAGLVVEGAGAVGQQLAYHGYASHGDWAGLGQAAGQRGELRGGPADRRPAERDPRRAGGGWWVRGGAPRSRRGARLGPAG